MGRATQRRTIALSFPFFPPQALLKLPSHLSQSEEVLKFFETTLEDLNPPTEWVTIAACLSNHHKDILNILLTEANQKPREAATGASACMCVFVFVSVWVSSWDGCLKPCPPRPTQGPAALRGSRRWLMKADSEEHGAPLINECSLGDDTWS